MHQKYNMNRPFFQPIHVVQVFSGADSGRRVGGGADQACGDRADGGGGIGDRA